MLNNHSWRDSEHMKALQNNEVYTWSIYSSSIFKKNYIYYIRANDKEEVFEGEYRSNDSGGSSVNKRGRVVLIHPVSASW